MKRIAITARTPDGQLLNDWGTNSDQLATERTERILAHHPDAVLTRTDQDTSNGNDGGVR
jgi:hypothetical protein